VRGVPIPLTSTLHTLRSFVTPYILEQATQASTITLSFCIEATSGSPLDHKTTSVSEGPGVLDCKTARHNHSLKPCLELTNPLSDYYSYHYIVNCLSVWYINFQVLIVLTNREESKMCFSPEASFAGGIIISAIGVATVKRIHKPSQLIFASIPLFFGIQQITEGFLWLTLPDPGLINIQKISTYLYLIMADVIWPSMIPVSVLLMEENTRKKRVLRIMAAIGMLLSLYYAFCLLSFDVNPQISGYHIYYKTGFPKALSNPALIVYLIVTITPLFVSSIKRTHILGMLMFLSCLVTAIFFKQYLTSVWCFFAALISGVIYWIIRDSKRYFILNKINLLKNS